MAVDLEKAATAKDKPVEAESDRHDSVHRVAEDQLRRSLSPRQVQMIAIGGTIG